MPRQFQALTGTSPLLAECVTRRSIPATLASEDDMLDQFMEFGYCVVKQAFTQKQAQELAGDVWVRLGMDPNDQSTWTKVGCARGPVVPTLRLC